MDASSTALQQMTPYEQLNYPCLGYFPPVSTPPAALSTEEFNRRVAALERKINEKFR